MLKQKINVYLLKMGKNSPNISTVCVISLGSNVAI